MIYLLDQELTEDSHSKYIIDIIKGHTEESITVVPLLPNPTYRQLYDKVSPLLSIVRQNDIVFCPWVVDANFLLDELFDDLAERCWVVVSAGNFNKDICEYSPARAEKVITVACLNKSGIKAALSNYSQEKELVWVAGTNYNVGWKNSSGTSVSGAVYTAFLAEALKFGSYELLTTKLEEYSKRVLQELIS